MHKVKCFSFVHNYCKWMSHNFFIVWQKSVNLRGLCFVTALCFKLTHNHESSINVSRRDWVPNQPQSFVFSAVNKIIIGTWYLVYKLPSHLIPLTDCCACINCDLCRLPSIKKDYAATFTGAGISQRASKHGMSSSVMSELDPIEPNCILREFCKPK